MASSAFNSMCLSTRRDVSPSHSPLRHTRSVTEGAVGGALSCKVNPFQQKKENGSLAFLPNTYIAEYTATPQIRHWGNSPSVASSTRGSQGATGGERVTGTVSFLLLCALFPHLVLVSVVDRRRQSRKEGTRAQKRGEAFGGGSRRRSACR